MLFGKDVPWRRLESMSFGVYSAEELRWETPRRLRLHCNMEVSARMLGMTAKGARTESWACTCWVFCSTLHSDAYSDSINMLVAYCKPKTTHKDFSLWNQYWVNLLFTCEPHVGLVWYFCLNSAVFNYNEYIPYVCFDALYPSHNWMSMCGGKSWSLSFPLQETERESHH